MPKTLPLAHDFERPAVTGGLEADIIVAKLVELI